MKSHESFFSVKLAKSIPSYHKHNFSEELGQTFSLFLIVCMMPPIRQMVP
ncbi:hypothetical protein AB434_3071 [Heyndrickxia coagulans]|uniref:Uncharacterized protein n=1 Tax=Heyndrickxia coagulans TaxID=1398 RepID=A0AAN0WC09_HEYCO|nr:hypothetical protein SB48_HM08orf03512 [Heyndrickxia coagulans]AKN55476.1 hypothetical protein AB434_3071 [Heyndrickxia coagulans]KYC59977.1 hypothetical protein B4100_3423 [Heyndrickxia coagulans]KYC79171.1 hypothetical protein B4096_3238 [Heyndrickxia coagulans]